MTHTTLTLPTDTTIRVERVFRAPIALVYSAHMEPEHVSQWLTGPNGWTLTSAYMDVRAGGLYQWGYTGPGGKTMDLEGEYLEVEPPTVVRMREHWGPDRPGPDVEMTFTSVDASDADREYAHPQTLVTTVMTLADQATRDMVVKDGSMESGYRMSHSQLDAWLIVNR
jgi:uncharacterized protein YndB with AHSA1/START domain